LTNSYIGLGAAEDTKMYFGGSGFIIQSDAVTATDYLLLRGGTNGIDFNIGATEQITLTDGKLAPTTDSDIDLGDTTHYFKLGFIKGVLQMGDAIYFTQTDGNEKIDSANDGYMDYGATTGHRFNNTVDITITTDPQLRLTHTDGVDECDFYVNADGELVIMPTARTVYIGDGTDGDNALKFYSDTSVYMLHHDEDNSALKLSANDVTNYTQFGADGDLVFVGTAGLPFADISVYNNGTADTIATATWSQMTRFDTDGENNNCTPDHTNDHITITKAGRYMVNVSASFSGDPNITWYGGVWKNNGGTQLQNMQIHRKLGAGGDVGCVSMSGIGDFAVNDTVEIWIRQDSGVDKAITIVDCCLAVSQLGGT